MSPWRLSAAMMPRLISRPASFRNLPPRNRPQISDRSQGKGLGPGQFRNVVRSQSGMRSADRRGEASLGVQCIAAGDKGEIVGAAAQLADEIGDQIVEPAGLADQVDERPARHGFWEAKMAASAGETQSAASKRSTIFSAGVARSFGATASRMFDRRDR
jgi:hypothetical protein